MHLVLMGVAGSGKSTIGQALASHVAAEFIEGDDLHSKSNLAKMASGTPLTDTDRLPWLDVCAQQLAHEPRSVLACSALKRSYRDRIRALVPDAVFIHLVGNERLLLERLAGRKDHFMKPKLLESQLATLEPLMRDEAGFEVEGDRSQEETVDHLFDRLVQNYDLEAPQ